MLRDRFESMLLGNISGYYERKEWTILLLYWLFKREISIKEAIYLGLALHKSHAYNTIFHDQENKPNTNRQIRKRQSFLNLG